MLQTAVRVVASPYHCCVGEMKEFRASSLSSAAEQRRFAKQLEVEEEDGDRQEEEVEEKGEVESKRTRHEYDRG